jgi:hypothetical protein
MKKKKNSKRNKQAQGQVPKVYKLPASAKEEPKILPSKYEEEPVKKGKTHYEEDEAEEQTEL